MVISFFWAIFLSPFFWLWHWKMTSTFLILPTKLWFTWLCFQLGKQPSVSTSSDPFESLKKRGLETRHILTGFCNVLMFLSIFGRWNVSIFIFSSCHMLGQPDWAERNSDQGVVNGLWQLSCFLLCDQLVWLSCAGCHGPLSCKTATGSSSPSVLFNAYDVMQFLLVETIWLMTRKMHTPVQCNPIMICLFKIVKPLTICICAATSFNISSTHQMCHKDRRSGQGTPAIFKL